MPEYVLGHQLKGEGARLGLMSQLLDPMYRRYIDVLGAVKPGARNLKLDVATHRFLRGSPNE
jgi:hypothetical protein